jgi:hypothetical protein
MYYAVFIRALQFPPPPPSHRTYRIENSIPYFIDTNINTLPYRSDERVESSGHRQGAVDHLCVGGRGAAGGGNKTHTTHQCIHVPTRALIIV